MANWWSLGVKTKEGQMLSSSIANNNMSNPTVIGSLSMTDEETKRILVFTTHSGTQLYAEIHRNISRSRGVYVPDEFVDLNEYTVSWLLRKEGTELKFSTAYTLGTTIIGDNNLYNYNYRSQSPNGPYLDNGRWRGTAHLSAYPIGKQGAGNNQQISMVSTDTGLYLYRMGFACTDTLGNYYNCPVGLIGVIPSSALLNPFWFDFDSDGLKEDDLNDKDIGGTGRPVDRSYNGVDIDFPELPTGASALGFSKMKMFRPTAAELGNALDILWSDNDDDSTLEKIIEGFKKWVYKPEQYLTSIMLTPVPVPDGASSTIYFGKYNTHVACSTVANQYAIVDCGSLSIPLMYGSYLDFTQVQSSVFLPYIGFRNINVAEIMGGTMHIKYYIDLFTGSGLCFIKCHNEGCNNSVLYTYECNVQTQIPITSNNYNNIVTNIQGVISSTMSAVGSGVAGNPMGVASSSVSAVTNAAGAVGNAIFPTVVTSGSLTGYTGALGDSKPYVALHFPVSLESSGYTTILGKPSETSGMLGSYSGFTKVRDIHLDFEASESVKESIKAQLVRGVVI